MENLKKMILNHIALPDGINETETKRFQDTCENKYSSFVNLSEYISTAYGDQKKIQFRTDNGEEVVVLNTEFGILIQTRKHLNNHRWEKKLTYEGMTPSKDSNESMSLKYQKVNVLNRNEKYLISAVYPLGNSKKFVALKDTCEVQELTSNDEIIKGKAALNLFKRLNKVYIQHMFNKDDKQPEM